MAISLVNSGLMLLHALQRLETTWLTQYHSKDETPIVECRIAARGRMAWQTGRDRDFQTACRRAGDDADPESGRRSASRSQCPRRGRQGGLRLPFGTL